MMTSSTAAAASVAAAAAAIEKKRAVMEERLQSHYNSYLRDATMRKSQTVAVADPRESLDAFLAVFSQRREEISLCLQEKKAALSLSSSSPEVFASVKMELESLLLEVGKMQKLVADSSFYLPTYTMQSAQAAITKLKEEVQTAMSDLLPKKKFSFKGKSTTTTASKPPVVVAAAAKETAAAAFREAVEVSERNPNPNAAAAAANPSFQEIQKDKQEAANPNSQGIQKDKQKAANPSFQGIQKDRQDAANPNSQGIQKDRQDAANPSFQGIQKDKQDAANPSFQGIQKDRQGAANPNSQGIQEEDEQDAVNDATGFQGIRDKQDAVLVRDSTDLEDREFRLSNLSNCRVYLQGKFRTLYVNKLRNCRVYAGPVTGSVLVEDVEDSLFMLASHQIRIHSTTATDFYLRVRSRPIVEYTKGIRFAPYAFHYSGIENDLRAANLMDETGLWESVDDFRWLRAVQSPNWSVLPSDQRISMEGPSQIAGENGP